jgi:hypothetical protein
VLTTDVRAGEFKILPDEIAEQQARLDAALVKHAIDTDANRNRTAHVKPR